MVSKTWQFSRARTKTLSSLFTEFLIYRIMALLPTKFLSKAYLEKLRDVFLFSIGTVIVRRSVDLMNDNSITVII